MCLGNFDLVKGSFLGLHRDIRNPDWTDNSRHGEPEIGWQRFWRVMAKKKRELREPVASALPCTLVASRHLLSLLFPFAPQTILSAAVSHFPSFFLMLRQGWRS
ncbi:unnamed protein product [Phaeothamnion confervicola]